MAPVIGTASATVIQSTPSMKFTRLTNQTPTTSTQARSSHSGSAEKSRASDGSIIRIKPTARHCTNSRGAGDRPRMSSSNPINASSATAPVSADSCASVLCGTAMVVVAASHTTQNVEMITPRPPPCGVGSRCDERATGCASAWDLSHGSRTIRMPAHSAAARIGMPAMIAQYVTSAPPLIAAL